MEIINRKSVNDDLTNYCYLAKENDFIEITEWTNKEGYDITINDRHFHLTNGELDAINHLVNTLKFEPKIS